MFFDVFDILCKKKGVTKNKALMDCGISRTAAAKWKGGSTPNGKTLSKVAEYFGVSVNSLLQFSVEDVDSPEKQKQSFKEADLKAAFFEGALDLTPDEMDMLWQDAKEYIGYKLEQRRRNK